MLPEKLAFVDIETTGMSAGRDRIIEVGVIRVENNKIVNTYQTLINPQTYINPIIESLTGITKETLENAPTFEDIQRDLHEILDDAVFVAHNVRFDYGFLKNEFKHLGLSFSPKHFCTVKLSKALFPKQRSHNLDSIIERFRIECKNRHRAFDDAKVLWDFYQKILTTFPIEKVQETLKFIMKRPSLPLNIPLPVLDELPSSPGVYVFYGENGAPLYVGKSKNIRERVLSHFASDHASSIEMKMSQQLQSIETIQTAGELGALFKESSLIKELQPLYNRKLRLSRKLLVLRETTVNGYSSVAIETVITPQIENIETILGIFKSKKQVKNFLIELVEKHSLCEKILGLEKTKSACFGYRLDRCKGACVEKEKPQLYNLRSLIAFSKHKIKPWPFNGPITIIEKHDDKKDMFVFDKWCYVGKEYEFDLDTYKILEMYLRSEKNLKNVQTMQSAYTDTRFSKSFITLS